MKNEAVKRSFSVYPSDLRTLEYVRRYFYQSSTSAALRYILRDWLRQNDISDYTVEQVLTEDALGS